MSATTKKIPAMFLRGLKRKSDAEDNPVLRQENENKLVKVSSAESYDLVQTSKLLDGELKKTVVEGGNKDENSVPTAGLPNESSKVPLCLRDLILLSDWKQILHDEFNKKYLGDVEQFLQREYDRGIQIFPPRDEIFTAFNLSPLKDIRVVIIGQDPYHDDGQAHGLSFSVKKGVKLPPSLKNIFKELSADIPNFVPPQHGFLEGWARQGVFMLNATLTVKAHNANSHAKIGWQRFTDHVIKLISNSSPNNVVFLLWGGFAHKKESLIDGKRHAVIKSAHPSPLSARFWWGCKCFSKTNEQLEKFGLPPIDWNDL